MRIATATLHRQATQAMLDQQSRLAGLQEQLARGVRLTRGADDPAAMAASLRLDDALTGITRDRGNIDTLRRRLGVEESALDQVTDTLQRVRELTVQGANATQTAASRRQIALELTARLDELVALANSTDGDGRFLFGGSRDADPPFVRGAGAVSYHGDDASRHLQVGGQRQLADGDPGSELFLRIPNGNGRFRLSADAANTGTATVTRLQAVGDTFAGEPLELVFAAGQYELQDAAGTSLATGAYVSGQAIAHGGISLTLEGQPADGDRFVVAPSRAQSLFDTVGQIAAALGSADSSPAAAAQRHVSVQAGLDDLDQAIDHLLAARGSVGARLSVLDQTETQLDAVEVELATNLSGLRDLDYASATTQFALQLTGLEAAQQSYLRVQSLSLFRLLG